MASFIEEFIFGTPNPKTGESDGGIAGALDTIVPDPTNPINVVVKTASKLVPLAGFGATTAEKAIQGLDIAVNYGLNRPGSTLLQAGNVANPLYKDGLQWDDFRQMFNASEYLSVGRAFETLQSTSATGPQLAANKVTGVDKFSYLSGYNPYPESGGMNAEQTEKLWDDSVFGTINSAIYDTGWAYVGGVKGVNLIGSGAKRAAGLATQVRGVRDLNKLSMTIDEGIKYAESGGAEGRRSVWGDHILNMAKSKDWTEIYSNPMINSWSKIGSTRQKELADLIQGIEDPRLVRDLILADKGDVSAVGRLFQNAPDHLWSLSDMNQSMRTRLAEYGDKAFTADEAARFNQTFDAALARDEFYNTVKKIFTQTEHGWEAVDEGTGLITNTVRNSDNIPMSGVAGKAQAWLYRQREAARNGSAGQWIDIRLGVAGKNAPATVLLQWLGGRKPLNMVTFSGTRPADIIDEILAFSASSRVWKGSRSVKITTTTEDGLRTTVDMTADQWRTTAQQRISRASIEGGDNAVAQTIQELEAELISGVINKYGVAPDKADGIIAALKGARDEAQKALVENGMFWDETRAARVIVDNGTRRMLTDNLVLIDIKRLDEFMRINGTTEFATKGRYAARFVQGANRINDSVLKWFRTAFLVKPGYVPKNSVAEPAIASVLSHGTMIAPDGIASVAGHFFQNWAKRATQISLKTKDFVWRGKGSTARMNRQLEALHMERMIKRNELEQQSSFIDTLDSAGTSPSMRAKNFNVAVEERKQLAAELKAIEAQIDNIDPIWRQVEEVPSYHEMSTKINLIDEATNASPEYIDSLRAKISSIESAAALRSSKDIAKIDTEITRLKDISKSLDVEISKVSDQIKSGTLSQEEVANLMISRDALLRRQASNQRRIDNLNTKASELVDESGVIKVKYSQSEQDALNSHRLQVGVNEKVASGDTSVYDEIVRLRLMQNMLREKMQDINPTSIDTRLDLLNDIKAVEEKIAGLQPKIASREARREAARERVFGGEKPFTIDLNGEVVIARGAFDQSQFGTAARAEASANLTATLTFNPGNSGRLATSRWQRLGDHDVIQPSDPGYWDELAHIANRQIRNDEFAKLVLSGADNKQIYSWLTETEAGRRYAQDMGWTLRDMQSRVTGSRKLKPMPEVDKVKGAAKEPVRNTEIPEFVDSIISQNRQAILDYFPTPEVRKLVLGAEDVRPSQLRASLGTKTDLVPVHSGTLQFNSTNYKNAVDIYNRALDAIWRGLMANPESRMFRWPWTQRQFQANMQADLLLLHEQGIKITDDVINNARPNAMARAVKEAEQTFYNIRRVSNPVYALRWLTYFPAAYFNSMYRYGRLAYKNPGRSYLMSHAWTSAYTTFGVDKEGNPSKDWTQTEAVVFRVPEAIKKKYDLPIDDKIALSVRGWEFATTSPSATLYLTLPVSSLVKSNPDLEPWLKENLPSDTYDFLFPLGRPNTGYTGNIAFESLFPSYVNEMRKMLDSQNEDSIQVASQIYQYRLFEWEKNGKRGPMPDPMKAQEEAANFFKLRFATKFFWSGGVGVNPIGEFYRNETRLIQQAYPDDIVKQTQVFLDLHGVPGDSFFISTSKNRAGIPYTVDAYKRLESFPELANKLRSMNSEDPAATVSLMFAETQGEFSSAVYDNLYNNALPGDSESIRSKRTPSEMRDAYLKQESWNAYIASKSSLDATMKQYGYSSLRSTGNTAWLYNQWHSWLDPFVANPMNQAWLVDYKAPDNGRVDRIILGLKTVVEDTNFMKINSSSPTYSTTKKYLKNLDIARASFDDASSTEQRIAIATQWQKYVEDMYLSTSASFANWYTRYLNDGRDLGGGRVLSSGD